MSRFSYPETQRNEVAREALRIGVLPAARKAGVPGTTVHNWVAKLKATETAAPPPEHENMQIEALKSQVQRLKDDLEKTKKGPARVDVEHYDEEVLSPEELWQRAEEENSKRIERAQLRSQFAVEFDKGPIGVTFISDQHISPGNVVDLQRMREDAVLVRDTPNMYAILGGDGVDNHIMIPTAMLAARSQPEEQWQLYNHYLSIFAEKIITMISGNHDAWTNERAGVDMVRWIAEKQRLCYAPHEAWVDIAVGDQKYAVAIRHKYRFNSSTNLCHTVKQWWRMGAKPFDIGCVCHHHEAAIEPFTAHGQQRWACRPGSYQIMSDYSIKGGWNSSTPACPTFILFPVIRRIVGFQDVRDGAAFLQSCRK